MQKGGSSYKILYRSHFYFIVGMPGAYLNMKASKALPSRISPNSHLEVALKLGLD